MSHLMTAGDEGWMKNHMKEMIDCTGIILPSVRVKHDGVNFNRVVRLKSLDLASNWTFSCGDQDLLVQIRDLS